MATRGGGVYFPVDAGFCDTTVARQVGRRLGAEGQWAYLRLLTSLLNEGGGRLPLAAEDEWEDLADRLGLPPDGTRELVSLMEHYGALVRAEDGSHVFSPIVSQGIATREAKRAAARKGNAKRWGASGEGTDSQSESQCD